MSEATPARSHLQTRFRLIVAVTVAIALAGGLLTSLWVADRLRRDIIGTFDREQLILARNAGRRIRSDLAQLQRDVELTARQVATIPAASRPQLLQSGLARLQDQGVSRLLDIDLATAEMFSSQPYLSRRTRQEIPPDLAEALRSAIADTTWDAGEVRVLKTATDPTATARLLVVPLAETREHLLIYDLDLVNFLEARLGDVRSGETGYTWLIDDRGIFLYHPDAAFRGADAFAVRQDRYPEASYARINRIQRDEMLQGREGVDHYISARHLGLRGTIEKRIAFAPVIVPDGWNERWSVAVVAPVGDLSAALSRSGRIVLVILLLVVGLVIAGGSGLLILETRWSRDLETRVAARTEQLQRSEERYRSLVESAEDAIFSLDADLTLRSANRSAGHLFDGLPADLVGRPLTDLLPESVATLEAPLIRRVFSTGSGVRSEYELGRGQRMRLLNASYMPLCETDGRVGRVLCVARDLTVQRRLEKGLANAEKLAALGTLAAGFAHEINNPLGIMLGFCDLLTKRLPEGSQERDDLAVIERQGLSCKSIVEKLLDISRQSPDRTEYTDLNRCLLETLAVVRHSLECRDIIIDERLADDLPPVRGDGRQLQQVFLNLINNAQAAMAQGGRLTLRTGLDDAPRQAFAEVADTGPGIDHDQLPHIFDPFYTTKPEGEGTGLGLFVSYGIIGKYGGDLVCDRREPTDRDQDAKGETVFRVTLPLQPSG